MPDIRLELGFLDHLKTRRLQRRCGPGGVLSLIRLWMYAAASAQDGDLGDMSQEEVEEVAGWDGEAGALFAALEEFGWLERAGKSLRIHDWPDWQPWVVNAPERKKQASHAAEVRWAKQRVCGEDAGSNAGSMLTADAPLPSSPLPSSPKEKNPPNPPVGGNGRDHPKKPRKPRDTSPKHLLGLALAARIGCTPTQAHTQVRALVNSGVSLEDIRDYIETSDPSLDPWDWRKAAYKSIKRSQDLYGDQP